jgi:hypothetical protein
MSQVVSSDRGRGSAQPWNKNNARMLGRRFEKSVANKALELSHSVRLPIACLHQARQVPVGNQIIAGQAGKGT